MNCVHAYSGAEFRATGGVEIVKKRLFFASYSLVPGVARTDPLFWKLYFVGGFYENSSSKMARVRAIGGAFDLGVSGE